MSDADYYRNAREGRGLAEADWLVFGSWDRLHHATLTEDQCFDLVCEAGTPGPVRLTCGSVAKRQVSIPGLFTRMGAPRCSRCCDALGIPRGKGSPKNDPQLRTWLEPRVRGLLPGRAVQTTGSLP